MGLRAMGKGSKEPVTRAELDAMVRRLKKVAPLWGESRVRVSLTSKLAEDCNWGDCDWDGHELYRIRIFSGLTRLEAEFCLLHEWAHALHQPWDQHQLCPGDHNDIWGGWYARVYRAYHEVD